MLAQVYMGFINLLLNDLIGHILQPWYNYGVVVNIVTLQTEKKLLVVTSVSCH